MVLPDFSGFFYRVKLNITDYSGSKRRIKSKLFIRRAHHLPRRRWSFIIIFFCIFPFLFLFPFLSFFFFLFLSSLALWMIYSDTFFSLFPFSLSLSLSLVGFSSFSGRRRSMIWFIVRLAVNAADWLTGERPSSAVRPCVAGTLRRWNTRPSTPHNPRPAKKKTSKIELTRMNERKSERSVGEWERERESLITVGRRRANCSFFFSFYRFFCCCCRVSFSLVVDVVVVVVVVDCVMDVARKTSGRAVPEPGIQFQF